MNEPNKMPNESEKARQPFRVRLPGLVSEKEVGLGDAIKHVTKSIGIKPCGGCNRRAEALNRMVVIHS